MKPINARGSTMTTIEYDANDLHNECNDDDSKVALVIVPRPDVFQPFDMVVRVSTLLQARNLSFALAEAEKGRITPTMAKLVNTLMPHLPRTK